MTAPLPAIAAGDVWGAMNNAAILAASGALARPASPNGKNDEFDGTSTATWTDLPAAGAAPTTWTANGAGAPYRLYVRSNGNGTKFAGKSQPVPGSYPYTVTTRVTSNPNRNTQVGLGLFLAGSPIGSSRFAHIAPNFTANPHPVERLMYASPDAGSSFLGKGALQGAVHINAWAGFLYQRYVVTAANQVTSQVSVDGVLWMTLDSNVDLGFAPAFMGLALAENGSADLDGLADFFRVT